MNCPNCGYEIQDYQNFCTNCGAKLVKSSKKNKTVVFIILLVFLIIVSAGAILFYKLKMDDSSLKTILNEQVTNLSTREALNLLNEQDLKLTEYKRFHKNIDEVFSIFYNNLIAFSGKETEFESKLQCDFTGECNNTDVQIKFLDSKSENTAAEAKITEPATKLFNLLFDCEGGYQAGINYDYLVQNYSNNLSTPWKAFLSLKQKENHKRGMYTYYCDGYPASADILVDWILAMDDFLIKYPDFPFNQNLKENYKTYVADMQRADIIDEHNMVIKDIKQAYEKFLNKATKGTTEYNDIENWYATLKKSNFRSTTPGFYNADY